METITEKNYSKHREIIPRSKTEKFWKVKNGKEEFYFTPSQYPDDEVNEFIIYLSGLSINEQIKKTKGLIKYPFNGKDLGIRENRFWQITGKDIVDKITNKKTQSGYYLVKIIEKIDTEFEIPENWRKASANEASEILQSIYQISELRYLENSMHIIEEENKRILAVGNFRSGKGLEIWRGHLEAFNLRQKRAIILIYQQK
jgi:hypothetical protein